MDLNNLERGELQDLQNHEIDFDQDAMWNNIEKDEKKRRPFFWIWWVGSLGIGLLVLVLFNYNRSAPNPTSTQTERMENTTPIANNNNSEKATQTISDEITEKKNEEKIEINIDNTNAVILAQNNRPQKSRASSVADVLKNTDNTSIENNIDNKNYNKINLSKVHIAQEQKTTYDSSAKDEDKKSISPTLAFLPGRSLAPLKQSTSVFERLGILESEMEEISGMITPNSDAMGPKFTVSAFAGLGYQFRMLSLKNTESNPDRVESNSPILAHRQNSEIVLESLSFGLELDRKIGEKWTIGSGIEMTVHTEKMVLRNRTISNLADMNEEEIPEEYQGRSGFLINRMDSVFYNRHRGINLPVRLGYRVNYKKIRLLPEVALILNLTQKSTGFQQNDFARSVPINSNYKTRTGISYRLGCKVFIPTKSGFTLFARPSFEWNPNDLATPEYNIRERKNLLRLDLGISRRF